MINLLEIPNAEFLLNDSNTFLDSLTIDPILALTNIFIGTDGDDNFVGGDGTDIFFGSRGNDALDGGLGVDVVSYFALDQAITLKALGVVDKGADGIDQLTNIEIIIGAEGQINVIDGTVPGEGSSAFVVDLSQESLTVTNIPVQGDVDFQVIEFVDVIGTDNDDSITGDEKDNFLDGRGGNDVIYGLAGDDTIFGGSGDDTINGNQDNDLIHGEKILAPGRFPPFSPISSNDSISGGSGNDTIDGGEGNDTISGGTGNDLIYGDSSNLFLPAGSNIVEPANNLSSETEALSIFLPFGNDDRIFGGNGRDTIHGGAGNDSIFGGSGNDLIYGDSSGLFLTVGTSLEEATPLVTDENIAFSIFFPSNNDRISGGRGRDTIYGGNGFDSISGDSGDDDIFGGSDNDTIEGGSGDDLIYGDNRSPQFSFNPEFIVEETSSSLNNEIIEFPIAPPPPPPFLLFPTSNDKISGGNGNDTIYGGDGSDSISGGSGNDLIYGDFDSLIVFPVTLDNISDNSAILIDDTIFLPGSLLDDTISGGIGDDTIFGGSGNDRIIGGEGNDSINGGSGEDTADYSSITEAITLKALGIVDKGTFGTDQLTDIEIIIGAEGQINVIDGTVSGAGSSAFVVDLSQESLTVTNIPVQGDVEFEVIEFVNVIGTDNDDSITGDEKDNFLEGRGGDDVIDGLSGDDTILGGIGNDTISGDDGNDRIFGDTTINGVGIIPVDSSPLVDPLDTSTSFIFFLINNDSISGGLGNDTIDGGVGNDTISGGSGNDVIYGDSSDLFLSIAANFEESANNPSNEAEAFSIFFPLEDNDSIFGGSGRDTIYGGVGNDTISGGNGHDLIYGDIDPTQFLFNPGFIFEEADNNSSDEIINIPIDPIFPTDDDSISGGNGNDTIYGGVGNDTISGDNGDDLIYGDFDTSILLNNSNNDILFQFVGPFDDRILGGNGDDTIYGGGGSDTISGDSGDDLIYGDNPPPQSPFNPGFIFAEADSSLNNEIIIDVPIFPPAPIFPLSDDSISGGDGDDTIYGGNGNDNISGDSGDDNINGGSDDDTIEGGSGDDTIEGGSGDDTIEGDSGNDLIYGDAPPFQFLNFPPQITFTPVIPVDINFGDFEEGILISDGLIIDPPNFPPFVPPSTKDHISGGSGDDTIYGGDGNDTISGDSGNDLIYGDNLLPEFPEFIPSPLPFNAENMFELASNQSSDATNMFFFELASNQSINTAAMSSLLIAVSNNDIISGGSGDDTIFGGIGSDQIDGGEGNDELIGVDTTTLNPGVFERDILTGGQGADSFILGNEITAFYQSSTSNGANNFADITDFESGVDTIQLNGNINDYFLTPGTTPQTFTSIFINNGTAGFDPSDDLIATVDNGFELSDLVFV